MLRALLAASFALFAGGAAAAFLSPLPALNAIARLEGAQVTSALAYGDGPRHGVDVYVPREGGANHPVVVFFYGGSWEDGDRASYRFVGEALASRGIVAVIPDYRVYPAARFHDFMQDAAQAFAWTHANIGHFGGDPSRIVLAGHSAGAHIAAMLTFDRRWLAKEGLDARSDIAGFAGLAGPYDFLPLTSPTLKTIFGPPTRLSATQPINFVRGGEAPAFLAAGTSDTTVDPGNTTRMAAAIRAHGGAVQVRMYERIDHRTIIGAFAAPLRFLAPSLADVATFVDTVTTKRTKEKAIR